MKIVLVGVLLSFIVFASCVNNESKTTYRSLKIGDQEWMSDNLDVEYYRNGDPIPHIKDPDTWSSTTTGGWCYFDNASPEGSSKTKLYNWYAITDPRMLAPKGWRVPTVEDFKKLSNFLGGDSIAGSKLKEEGFAHWDSSNVAATNITGFNAVPTGARSDNGAFFNPWFAYFWTSTDKNYRFGWTTSLTPQHEKLFFNDFLKKDGFPVRCIKE